MVSDKSTAIKLAKKTKNCLSTVAVSGIVFGVTLPASAATFGWNSSDWGHGGIGWQAGNTIGTTTVGGVALTVELKGFGTRGGHSFPEISPELKTGTIDSGDTVLTLGSSKDYNTNSLNNYTRLDFTFDKPVFLNDFLVGDLDDSSPDSSSWQDFVAVEAFNNGNSVGVSYGLASGGNQQYYTSFGKAGVLGINDVNYVDFLGSHDASTTVSFANNPVTNFQVYYFQGPEGTLGDDHGVWVSNIETEPVPEPLTILGSAAALGFGALFKKRQRKKA